MLQKRKNKKKKKEKEKTKERKKKKTFLVTLRRCRKNRRVSAHRDNFLDAPSGIRKARKTVY